MKEYCVKITKVCCSLASSKRLEHSITEYYFSLDEKVLRKELNKVFPGSRFKIKQVKG